MTSPTDLDALNARAYGLHEDDLHPTLRQLDRAHEKLTLFSKNKNSNSPLEFHGVREFIAQVDAEGPRSWLARGVWPAGDYGLLAGPMKSQKTWGAIDMVVSVASGKPWLGHVPVDSAGPVVVFAGEGGASNLVRRMRAVAEARDVVLNDLPISICTRSPHLNNQAHIDSMNAEMERVEPKLVVIDPLYLSLRGASSSSLVEMGALLERVQHIAQDAGSSLLLVHHHNRKDGRGAGRISGAGPAEWGRVLITVKPISAHTDAATKTTDVVTELDFIGGQISDQRLRLRRKIWTDDPDNLDSPLHIEIEVSEGEESQNADNLPPAARKLLEALGTKSAAATSSELVDEIANRHGHGLKRETVSRHLNDLERRGLVESEVVGPYKNKLWSLIDTGREGVLRV